MNAKGQRGRDRRAILGDEAGTLTAVNTVAVMLCVLLIVFVLNAGRVANEKIQLQDAADAVAHTSALGQARALNALTATNHVIGEVLSLVILHHAIGGDNLDANQAADTSQVDADLDAAYREFRTEAAKPGDPLPLPAPAYETVRDRQGVRADKETALFDSKVKLKNLLTAVYASRAVAEVMERVHSSPWVVALGMLLERTMFAREGKILQEYATLNLLESIARALVPLKQLLRDKVLPAAKAYTTLLVRSGPEANRRAAENIAQADGAQGLVYPLWPALPVVVDPFAKAQPGSSPQIPAVGDEKPGSRGSQAATRDQIVKTTQLARASFPWVVYHRQPLLDLMARLLPLAGTAQQYRDYTFKYSIDLCNKFQMDREMGLYVLKSYPAPDKGYALWTEQPETADPLFSTIGLAYFAPPTVVGGPVIFRQQHQQGRIAYAQAIVYNGNSQVRPPQRINLGLPEIIPDRQADCGWDTLNWKSGTRPWEMVSWAEGSDCPEIQLNWQAKLVPASTNRLNALVHDAPVLPDPFRPVVGKLLASTPAALTTH